jgi:hypothetical protein
LLRPEAVDQLIATDRPTGVERQIGEQQAPLARGQRVLHATPVELDQEAAAELDPGAPRGLQGFSNLVAIRPVQAAVHVETRTAMSAVIRCECGWSVEADSRERAVSAMERHVADEHPDLTPPPSRADLLTMAEES